MSRITTIVCDVDGTLTDGSVAYDGLGVEAKSFSIKDGLVLKAIRRLGYRVVLLTGRTSEIVVRRGAELDVADVIQGIVDKRGELSRYLREHGIGGDEVAYIGDDLNDLAAMRLCGFLACPADAAREIAGMCDYVSPFRGGRGAVRDICERILERDGAYGAFLELYDG